MRIIPIGALLLLAAPAIGAQQDSTARRDSLLERERRRIRGEAVAREPERRPDSARTDGLGWRSRVRVGAGVASPSTWLEDASGLSVASRVAPVLSAEIRFPRPADLEYIIGLRASRAGVVLDAGSNYDAGSIYLLDTFAGASRGVDGRLTFRAGIVGALVAGGDVAPFTEASRLAPGGELGVALRITDRVPFWIALGGQVLRYGGSGTAPTGAAAGAVYRLMLEVRHGR